MFRRGPFALVVALAAAALRADEPPKLEARKLEASLQAAIARAESAIACVQVYRLRDRAADERNLPPDVFGSGIVVHPSGLVLTCAHVVRDEVRVRVRLPGKRNADGSDGPSHDLQASVFATDYRSDLAVLKLPQQAEAYPSLAIGRSEGLRKGSMIVALGHPFAAGFRDGSASASWGIVSNLRRRVPAGTSELDRDKPFAAFGTLIQTDARLQLGCSGGALVDLDGKLVGVTTATAALTGVESPGGYAVPLDANARRILDVLLRGEEVEYGFLGVGTGEEFFRRTYAGPGVQLTTVSLNSPADRAGLSREDVILQVNGQPIREREDLFLALGAGLAGHRAELVVRRAGSGPPQTIEVLLAKAASKFANKATNRPPAYGGLRVDYTSVIEAGGGAIPEGVLVREVQGAAKSVGLMENVDVISEVNGQRVGSPADFHKLADKALKASDSLRLTVRGSPPRTVTLPW